MNKNSNKIKKVILIIVISIVVLSLAALLIFYFVIPEQEINKNNQIRDIAYSNTTDTVNNNKNIGTKNNNQNDSKNNINNNTNNSPQSNNQSLNWNGIKSVNSEIVGWLKVPHTTIDNPVMLHKGDNENNQYYLNKDYRKNYNINGSCFIDYRSGANAKNIIIHAHHMNDGSMFGQLMKYGTYSGNLGFYKSAPTFKYSKSNKKVSTYKIISVLKTNTDSSQGKVFNYLIGNFYNKAEFLNYVYQVKARSLINCPVKVNENDELITLSTCSYEYKDFRTVVVARKVRNGESSKVDTSKAKLQNGLWPDIHYSNKSKKPKVTTFLTEFSKSKNTLDWYDGNGNISGDERLL